MMTVFKRKSSLKYILLLPIITLYLATVVVFCGLIFSSVNTGLKGHLDTTLNLTQQLFVNAVENDLLVGADSEVYRKCKKFFSNKVVLEVSVEAFDGRKICDFSQAIKESSELLEKEIFFDEGKSLVAGVVRVSYSTSSLVDIVRNMALLLSIAASFVLFLNFYISRKIRRFFSNPIEKLSEELSRTNLHGLSNISDQLPSGMPFEISNVYNKTEEMAGKIINYQEQELEQEKLKVLSDLAHQVAHDIRSPLTALDMATWDLSQVSEERRVLIRTASRRIHDIANDLMKRYRGEANDSLAGECNKEISPHLISSVLESVVSEKRLQYRSQIDVEIEISCNRSSYGLFSKVNSVELKRLLSNLINNAVEAVEGKGRVILSLSCVGGDVIVIIEDDGKGMPKEVLERIGERGFTYGKTDSHSGAGLGLHHAKSTIKSWSGQMLVTSEVSNGTQVKLVLPSEEPPVWFVREISLKNYNTIVVLDDDVSIHETWKRNFKSIAQKNINIVHLSGPKELVLWLDANDESEALFLIDYEFLGDEENGLELIARFSLADQAVLVTSHFEEVQVKNRCLDLGIKLLPKGLASLVPIVFNDI